MPRDMINHAFLRQRAQAKSRGIPFRLTFDQWFAAWQASGRLLQRGRKRGQFCMGRVGDVGAYEVGNIIIIPFGQNVSDGVSGSRHGRARLSVAKAAIIRRKFVTGVKALALAKEYRVGVTTIYHAIHKRRWSTGA